MLSKMIPFFAAPTVISYRISRSLDRTFTDTPASGGGNVTPDTFTRNGATWQIWQVIPFLGSGVFPPSVGDCRIHIRDTSVDRDQNLLANMPSRIVLSAAAGDTADWTDLPWEFTRPGPAASNKFTSPGSGNDARRGIDYEPVRNVSGLTPSGVGIAEGESFTITIYFD